MIDLLYFSYGLGFVMTMWFLSRVVGSILEIIRGAR